MLIKRQVRLTKAILAAARPKVQGERRHFVRLETASDKVVLPHNLTRWAWAFRQARESLKLPKEVATEAILPTVGFAVSNTSTYDHNYREKGVRRSEPFECLSAGRVLEWCFNLATELPPHVEELGKPCRPPDEEEFDQMLAYIGENFGMSEWGHAVLYGTFKVV